MINFLHALIHRPEKGWDPVPPEHVSSYAHDEWVRGANSHVMDRLEKLVGGFRGREVLDLGGGPGHYSVAFAERGARTTWFDVSARYQSFAASKAAERGVEVEFVLGYLDEAATILQRQFDLVFNRICWNYCRGDGQFADVVFSLVKPGGVGYVDTNNSRHEPRSADPWTRFRTSLNEHTRLKIGHPFPPRGRIADLFLSRPVSLLNVDYRSSGNDRIFFVRSPIGAPKVE
jgi:2-polyprenyl-3-methyl-5-hydroxy-6-metoxy-1,4-benzoquinol methylase